MMQKKLQLNLLFSLIHPSNNITFYNEIFDIKKIYFMYFFIQFTPEKIYYKSTFLLKFSVQKIIMKYQNISFGLIKGLFLRSSVTSQQYITQWTKHGKKYCNEKIFLNMNGCTPHCEYLESIKSTVFFKKICLFFIFCHLFLVFFDDFFKVLPTVIVSSSTQIATKISTKVKSVQIVPAVP